MTARLPAKLEVSSLIRATQAAGGFAMVLARGEPDSGTIVVVAIQRAAPARLFERMPRPDGTRAWECTRIQDPQNPAEFTEYLDRRHTTDPDLWVIELDVADPERLLA